MAAKVIGLTNSRTKPMTRRLERLFKQPPYDPASKDRESRFTTVLRQFRGAAPMAWFYLWDMRPAVHCPRASARR